MKTKIYGASDDLIEIEGAVNDEIGCYFKARKTILCSDNTKATIAYDGEWKINVLVEGEKYLGKINSVGDDAKHIFPDAEGLTSYSDVLVLGEGIEWVKISGKTFKADTPTKPHQKIK